MIDYLHYLLTTPMRDYTVVDAFVLFNAVWWPAFLFLNWRAIGSHRRYEEAARRFEEQRRRVETDLQKTRRGSGNAKQ